MNGVGTPKNVCIVDCICLFFLLLDVLCGVGGRLFLLVLLLSFAVFGRTFCFGLWVGPLLLFCLWFSSFAGVYRVDIVLEIAS
jgi:hypothetical protein